MIATLCLLPLTFVLSEQQDVYLEDNLTRLEQVKLDPSFDSTLNSPTYTPDDQIKLEIDLSCMDYQSIYDIDGDGEMDFDCKYVCTR